MKAGDYDELNQLGSGSFGEVFQCRSKTDGLTYAVKKMVVLNAGRRKSAETEVGLMCKLNHANIVLYKGTFTELNVVHIVMEYCDGGDVAHRIGKQQGIHFSEDLVAKWFIDVCGGLHYLHSQNVIHRDLKPQNILLTITDTAKIADFGISRMLRPGDLASTVAGTPLYQSPEIALKQKYDYKTDIWSLGCCVYEMMTLNPAIDAVKFVTAGLRQVGAMPVDFSDELTTITTLMLTQDPADRPSVDDILDSAYVKFRLQMMALSSTAISGLTRTARIRKLKLCSDQSSTTTTTTTTTVATVNPVSDPAHHAALPVVQLDLSTLLDTLVSQPQSTVQSATSLTVSSDDSVDVTSTMITTQIPSRDAGCFHMTTPGGISVTVRTGNIAEQKCDVLVSPVDSRISFSGGASKAIADAAGEELKLECAQFIQKNKQLQVTGMMHTTAGKLQPGVRYVIHTCGPLMEQFQDQGKLRDAVFATFYNCMQYANDTLKANSMALPAISSGTFRVPANIVGEEAYKALTAFDNKTTKADRHLMNIDYVCLIAVTTVDMVAAFRAGQG